MLANKYLIAIDSGHGYETAGKRSPILPNGYKSSTGNVMHEIEYNYATALYLKERLEKHGFRTMLTAPNPKVDTSLGRRVLVANEASASLFISIHANAFSYPQYGKQKGLETFYATNGSENSKKLANLVQSELVSATGLHNRGVKTAGFYVIRATKMPAILVEGGFMDNVEEVKLLLSDAYRRKCAEALCKSVCKYYGVEYKPSNNIVDKVSDIIKPITPKPPVVQPVVNYDKHWANGVYEKLNKQGVVISDKRYNDKAKASEIIVLLDKVTKVLVSKGKLNFKYDQPLDGSDIHWAANSLISLNNIGFGVELTKFNSLITRKEALSYIARYLKAIGIDFNIVLDKEGFDIKELFKSLNNIGLDIKEERFNDYVNRGELLVFIHNLLFNIIEKKI